MANQHCGIYLIGSAACEDVGRIGLEGDAMAAIGRRAEEARRDFADSPLVRKPSQLRQRKPGAAVVGRGVHAIIGDMRNPQIMSFRSIAIVDLVKLSAAIVFGARSPLPPARTQS